MRANYVDTYKTYKEGTKRITTWLVNAARRCGVEVDFLNSTVDDSSGSTKAKNGSRAKVYHVPLSRYVSLAQAIATSENPQITLPNNIAALLQKVIELRKQANAFFSKLKNPNTGSNDRHRHFIDVLQEVLSVLQPTTPDAAHNPGQNGSSNIPTNLFEALSVEEPADTGEFESEKKPKSSPHTIEYDIESSENERIFAMFAFFKDVNDIREYIQSVWIDYLAGDLDLMSAAVTTDTAFNLLQSSWDEIMDAGLGVEDYLTMVGTMLSAMDRNDSDIDSFMAWVCYDTRNLLDEYVDVLKVNPMPVPIPGAVGTYDPKSDRSKFSMAEKHREDRILLIELLPEFTYVRKAKMELPTRDLLTTGLKQMIEAKSVDALPPYALFATKTLLDVHHILRDKADQPFMELQATARRVVRTIDEYFRKSHSKINGSWKPEHNEMLRHFQDFTKIWVLNDEIGTILRGPRNAQGFKPRPFYLLKNHPILCGLLTFRLNTLMNDIGINLCDGWGSLMYPAHLYNGVRHSAGLESEWDDMEYVFRVHTPQRIFVGAPPSDVDDYYKRCILALGTSAVNFAKNRRRGGPEGVVESRKGPRGLKATSPVKDIFRDRYVDDGFAALSTGNVVAMTAVATKAERIRPAGIDMNAFSRKILIQKQYTILQLLQAVREGVASEEMHLLFDYFGLHHRGIELLEQVRKKLHDDLVENFGTRYLEDDTQLPYVVAYIFEAMANTAPIAGNKMLHDASTVVAQFLSSGAGRKSMPAAKNVSNGLESGR